MGALPLEIHCVQVSTVGGEGGDPLLPVMKKKEPERIEFAQGQTAQKERGFFPVLCGEQGGTDQSTAESRPVRERRLGVPIE